MARIAIIIDDTPPHNVSIEIHCDEVIPDNTLLYTPAMHVMKDLEHYLKVMVRGLNDSKNQDISVF